MRAQEQCFTKYLYFLLFKRIKLFIVSISWQGFSLFKRKQITTCSTLKIKARNRYRTRTARTHSHIIPSRLQTELSERTPKKVVRIIFVNETINSMTPDTDFTWLRFARGVFLQPPHCTKRTVNYVAKRRHTFT